MSYEERVKAFWTVAESKRIKSNERFLMLALLEIWRRKGFPVPCPISNAEIGMLTGWTAKNVWSVKKTFLSSGLCWCKEGNGLRRPVYYFDAELVPDELKAVKVEKPKKKPRPRPKAHPKAQEQNLFSAKELGKTDKANEESRKRKKKGFTPPTLKECIAAFVQKGSTEAQARLFFDYFNSQDWYKSNGRTRVTNVDSAINYWINRKKDERIGNIGRGVSNREKRNNDLKEELLARYGKV